MDILNTENLVELHEKLNEFAKHHKNKGGQEALQLIKMELVEKTKCDPQDGGEETRLISEGYNNAIKRVLDLLHRKYVP